MWIAPANHSGRRTSEQRDSLLWQYPVWRASSSAWMLRDIIDPWLPIETPSSTAIIVTLFQSQTDIRIIYGIYIFFCTSDEDASVALWP
jgi:hypothetical protein